MKNKKIIGSLILISFVLMYFSPMFNQIEANSNLNVLNTSQEIRYTEISEPIYIDGNFSDVVDLYDWASGSGDIFDPYTIKEVSFLTGARLIIENVEFFKVENCRFFNYSRPYGHYSFAGLAIGNSSFGIIQNNIIVNCSNGISLYRDCEDIQILNNQFFGSHNDPITGMGQAILIYDAISVIMEGNAITKYYVGIHVRQACKIFVRDNRIEAVFFINGTIPYVSDTGVYYYKVNDSSIVDNDFIGCESSTQDSYNIETSGETEEFTPLKFDNCINITVYGNKYYDIYGNPIDPDIIDPDNELYWMFILAIGVIVVGVIGYIIYKKRSKSKI